MIVRPGRVARPFEPPWWTRGGHRQTILGFWYRRHLRWHLPTEDLIAESGPDFTMFAAYTVGY